MAMFLGASAQDRQKKLIENTPDADPWLENLTSTATAGDAMDAGIGQAVDEDTFFSSHLNAHEQIQQDMIIAKMESEGYNINLYRGEDGKVNRALLKKDTNYPGLKDADELWRQKQDTLNQRATYAAGVAKNNQAAFLGGQMIGGMGADPVMAATALIAAPASMIKTAYTFTQGAVRLGAAEAGAGLIGEAIVQVPVYSYKQELGRDYDMGDVAAALGMSAAFGGVIGGLAGGIAAKLRGRAVLKDLDGNPLLPADKQAEVEAMAADMEANPERITPKEFREIAASLVRKTDDELTELVYEAGTGVSPRMVEMADRLLKARENIQKGRAPDFQAATVFDPKAVPSTVKAVEGELPVGPSRVASVEKAGDPVELTKLRRTLTALLEELDPIRQAVASREKSKNPRQAKKANKADKARIAELEEKEATLTAAIAKSEEAQTAPLQAAEDARAAKVADEVAELNAEAKERAAELNAEAEAWLHKAYEDDLIRTDMAWLRQAQKTYEEQSWGRSPRSTDKSPREKREESGAPTPVRTTEGLNALEGSNNKKVSDLRNALQGNLRDADADIDTLKKAEACLNA